MASIEQLHSYTAPLPPQRQSLPRPRTQPRKFTIVEQTAALTARKATPADLKGIKALVESAFRGDTSRLGWTTEADLISADVERVTEAELLQKINQPNGAVLLTQNESGEIIACAEITKNGNTALLSMAAVNPLMQSSGLGTIGLVIIEDVVRHVLDVEFAEIHVIWARTELIDWYCKMGFDKTGRTAPFPYADKKAGDNPIRDDLYFIVLSKRLNPPLKAKL